MELTLSSRTHGGADSGIGGWLAGARRALADHQRYLSTLREMRALTDRELADIGISRLVIADIAHEAVYGK